MDFADSNNHLIRQKAFLVSSARKLIYIHIVIHRLDVQLIESVSLCPQMIRQVPLYKLLVHPLRAFV